MKALEILVNGERKAIIGNPNMETLDFAYRYFSDGNVRCVSHAIFETDIEESVCEYWPEVKLHKGDTVTLQIVEVASTEEIDKSFPGTHRRTNSGGLELACSIC